MISASCVLSPRDRQVEPSPELASVVRDGCHLHTYPRTLPDRSIWLGQQHRDDRMGCHATQKVNRYSTAGRIWANDRVDLTEPPRAMCDDNSTVRLSRSFLRITSELPCLQPIRKQRTYGHRLKYVVLGLPFAGFCIRSDAANGRVSSERGEKHDNQHCSFHAYIVPQRTESRKKTRWKGVHTPQRSHSC
jgi:hypothetical protein